MTPSKPCAYCQTIMVKSIRLSMYDWEKKRYCNRSCLDKAKGRQSREPKRYGEGTKHLQPLIMRPLA